MSSRADKNTEQAATWTIRPSRMARFVLERKMRLSAKSKQNRTELISNAIIATYWPKDAKVPCPVEL